MKIVCLGNEFVEGDSLAVEVGAELKKRGFDVVFVRDSFELMEIVSSDDEFVILDVVEGLDCVRKIGVKDLRVDSIMSAHDFDASYVLKLLREKVRIIGIPRSGDVGGVILEVEKIL